MWWSDNDHKMVLLLLAMKIDGIKDEELDLFMEIAGQNNISSSNIQNIKSEAKKLLMLDEPIKSVFEEYAKKNVSTWYKKDNAQFLWTLVNMGFIDKDYSDNERELVDTYCEIAKIDKVFARELEDTAEAMSAIVKQKEFLKNSAISLDKAKVLESELNKNQAVLENSIKELISLSVTLK